MRMLFAEGMDLDTQDVRIEYKRLDELHPEHRFPVVIRRYGDGTEECVSLTPAQGKWLGAQLTRMFE